MSDEQVGDVADDATTAAPDEPSGREHDPYDYGGRRKKGRSVPGCLAVIVAVALLGGGLYFGVTKSVDFLKAQLDSASDFPGPGRGKVTFEVASGDSATVMCRNMKDKGVVQTVDACVAAANDNPETSKIQVGFYQLKKEMSSPDAFAVLVDPANLLLERVTIPEGLRLEAILDTLGKKTDFSREQYEKVLEDPASIGLPDYAEGNAEGYLFPSTYDLGPKDTPKTILTRMVDRWRQAADEANLEERAAALGHTPAELMIIASLIEAEGRGDDMPKISRVIYNRLDGPGDQGGTNGRLQIDASIAYGLGLDTGSTEMTEEQLNTDGPYNTRTRAGLPPTPIEAPGDAAIAAAANPADGPWYYYVTVNLATGETRFYADYAGFLEGQNLYKEYCDTSDRC